MKNNSENNITLMTLSNNNTALFTWSYGRDFFLETNGGNHVWSSPEYGGDNSIIEFDGNYETWLQSYNIPYGRDKGKHVIREYCGDGVVIFWKTHLKCKDCGCDVIATGSDRPRDDYAWKCVNSKCNHYKEMSHTGDLERPDWVDDIAAFSFFGFCKRITGK